MKKKKGTEQAEGGAMSAALRGFLYFTACVTGAGILIVEILGAKMLSPYLGTSHFVWTAQIAVTLLALSAGYYVGGWLVDRSPKLNRLYYAILASAVYLCATVPMVKPLCLKLMRLPLEWAALLASAFLFLVPLALLAMTGPFLVRMLTQSVKTIGTNMGRLTAISTLGSVAGAVLIGFVLIPHLPNSVTMLITAGVLVALSAVFLIIWGRSEAGTNAILVAVGIGLALGYSGLRGQFGDKMKYGGVTWDVLYRANSNYGELLVIEYRQGSHAELRYLNDKLIQNTYDPNSNKSRSLFTGALRWLAHAYTRRIERALCIGMGVGVVPMQFAADGIETDVVEINGAVVAMAEQFFDFNSSQVNLTIGDGRQFLNQTDQKYDAIILDAFLGDSSPSHLMTQESFAEIRQHLTAHGVLVINSFGESSRERQYFSSSIDQTLRAVFGENRVTVHASGQGNVFFVAASSGKLSVHHAPQPPDAESASRMKEVKQRTIPFKLHSELIVQGKIKRIQNRKKEISDRYSNIEINSNSNIQAKLKQLNKQKAKWDGVIAEMNEIDNAILAEWETWRNAAESKGPFFSEHIQVQGGMGLMWIKQREFDPQQGRILRDDFNPVEFYDARNREENRRYLIEMLGNNDG